MKNGNDFFERTRASFEQIRFVQSSALYCLFQNSDLISETEKKYLDSNGQLVSVMDRGKELTLRKRDRTPVSVEEWGLQILEDLRKVASTLDSGVAGGNYLGVFLKNVHLQLLRRTPALRKWEVRISHSGKYQL